MEKPDKKPDEKLIDQLLYDPLVELLMHADKVDRDTMAAMLRRTALTLPKKDLVEALIVQDGFLEDDDYRSGVGIMLLNRSGQVLVGRRADQKTEAWQMPQGGIDPDETPSEAALRELREETGVDKVELLAETDGWLRYDYPPEIARYESFKGQQQKWFAMLFTGDDADINLGSDHPEFSAWRWASPEHLPELIIAFKRQLYRNVTAAFSKVMGSQND